MKQPQFKNPPVILEYELVKAADISQLDEKVNALIKSEGLQPFGAPDIEHCVQAMVLYEVEDV